MMVSKAKAYSCNKQMSLLLYRLIITGLIGEANGYPVH